MMRFSLRLNNDLTIPEYVQLAQVAEAVGFDQFWVSNDLFLRSCPVILAAIAQATKKIEIGSCILNPYTIDPSEIAMMAATLDELSGNRFNLGLAAGAGDFLQWVGIEQERPLAAVRETIQAVRQLLAGERAPFAGEFLQWSDEAYLRFKAPRITPIYIGAMGPKMLQLTGEIADGALPLLFPPEHYFTVKPHIDAGLTMRAQRVPTQLDTFDLAACIWVSLSDDPAAARRPLAQKIAYYGHALGDLILQRLGVAREEFVPIEHAIMVERDEEKAIAMVDERMLHIGVVGTANNVIERLEPLVAAGVRHLSFGPPLGPEPIRAIRMLGEVISHYANF
ncbi:MAG: LLM class flavin-dependent oxidoreductase [Caldilineaceae bacterium]